MADPSPDQTPTPDGDRGAGGPVQLGPCESADPVDPRETADPVGSDRRELLAALLVERFTPYRPPATCRPPAVATRSRKGAA